MAESYDEQTREIITHCSGRVLGIHSDDDLVAKCREERDKLDKLHKRKYLIINDPIHGTIKLNSLEKAIIDTPEFYRLRDIKQLGPLFHVYPGATHTRFEHSIGVCYVAGELVDHLEDEIKEVNGNKDKSGEIILQLEHKMCVRLAALCHDLGFGPFSHVFKKVSKKLIPEDQFLTRQELSQLIFKKILLDYPVVLALFRDYGLMEKHVKMIESMIIGESIVAEDLKISFETLHNEKLYLNFLYEIVNNSDNGMDVDKWDYFARDCYYLGLSNEFTWRRSMELSTIVKVKTITEHELHIGFRDKEVNNIYGMFRTRSLLHQKAYQHSKGILIDLMIEDILILIQDVEIIIEDKKPTRISLKKALEMAIIERADLTGYLALSDGILNHIMHAVPVETNDDSLIKARELIRRIQCREIYEIIAEKHVHEKEILKSIYLKDVEKEDLVFFYCQALTEKQEESTDIKQVVTKFTSEKSIDPVKDIYFFEKEKIADDFVEGKKLSDSKILQERVSKLINVPRVFEESKLLIYLKKKGINKDDIRSKISFKELEL